MNDQIQFPNQNGAPAVGQRVAYTGDMANASGMGWCVQIKTMSSFGYVLALDDGRFFQVSAYSFDGGPGCRFFTKPGALLDAEDCAIRAAEIGAEQVARREAQEAKQAQRAALEAKGAEIAKTLLAGCKAVIVAEYQEDDSDPYSDYSGSKRLKTVVLCGSKHTRDLFPEMRKAAAGYGPTADMATGGTEHRQKYSMGGGYFLTSWKIRKLPLGSWSNSDIMEALGRDGGFARDEPATTPEPAADPLTTPIYSFSGIR